MSRDSVVAACGPPIALEWHPPDYRDSSLFYFFDHWDIDGALCPGAAYSY